MIGAIIRFVLTNLPAILLFFAILAGVTSRRRPHSEALLSWLLLLPIGVSGIWAAIYHLVFPNFAAAFIGWQPSPFQFEVGVADLAYGATACAAFWRSLSFKAAVPASLRSLCWVTRLGISSRCSSHVILHPAMPAWSFTAISSFH